MKKMLILALAFASVALQAREASEAELKSAYLALSAEVPKVLDFARKASQSKNATQIKLARQQLEQVENKVVDFIELFQDNSGKIADAKMKANMDSNSQIMWSAVEQAKLDLIAGKVF